MGKVKISPLEIFIWFMLAVLVSCKPFLALIGKKPVPFILDDFLFYITLGVLFLLFPFVYLLIFGRLPFAQIPHFFHSISVVPVESTSRAPSPEGAVAQPPPASAAAANTEHRPQYYGVLEKNTIA